MKIQINIKIVGHELVEQKDGDGEPYDMLKLKLRGIGDDRKTVSTLLLDPERKHDFPLGDKGELVFEIRQQRLPLEDKVGKGKAAKPESKAVH